MITANEKYLSFNGYEADAWVLVQRLRYVYDKAGEDMPKVINDFVFNLEVALQNAGVLDEHFNLIDQGEENA